MEQKQAARPEASAKAERDLGYADLAAIGSRARELALFNLAIDSKLEIAEQVLLNVLNGYFDSQVPAILKHGGEVLKFMGDGLLAIFPVAATVEAGR